MLPAGAMFANPILQFHVSAASGKQISDRQPGKKQRRVTLSSPQTPKTQKLDTSSTSGKQISDRKPGKQRRETHLCPMPEIISSSWIFEKASAQTHWIEDPYLLRKTSQAKVQKVIFWDTL